MTIGHLKEIIEHLPDEMLVMAPMDIGNESLVVPVCNKSRVRQIAIDEGDQIATVLFLQPCVCGLEITEDQQEIAHAFMINDAIDN